MRCSKLAGNVSYLGSMSDILPPSTNRADFHRSLPTKRMGSGAVIADSEGRILVVNPTYKPGWELPGGVVETGESPADACRREVREELGIDVEVGELMCVDYNRATPDYVESLMFLFRIPPLSPQRIDAITLPDSELSEYRFCTLEQANTLLPDRVARRLSAVLGDASDRHYLDDQQPIW